MSDQRIQYEEEMVGAGHPTKSDTLNRLALVEAGNEGKGKYRYFTKQTADPSTGTDEGVLYAKDDEGELKLFFRQPENGEIVSVGGGGYKLIATASEQLAFTTSVVDDETITTLNPKADPSKDIPVLGPQLNITGNYSDSGEVYGWSWGLGLYIDYNGDLVWDCRRVKGNTPAGVQYVGFRVEIIRPLGAKSIEIVQPNGLNDISLDDTYDAGKTKQEMCGSLGYPASTWSERHQWYINGNGQTVLTHYQYDISGSPDLNTDYLNKLRIALIKY